MIEQSEIRRSPRIRTWFETHFSSQRQEGEGVLADVSYTGARVEDTGIQPSIGALAILYVCLPDDPKPFQLEGRVTRHTDAGFAIEYARPDQDMRRGVDRIAEMVGLREASPTDSSGPTPIDSSEPTAIDPSEPTPVDSSEPTPVDSSEPTAIDSSEPTAIESVEDDLSVTQPRRPEMPHVSELDLTECEVCDLEMLAERIASELTRRREDSKRRVREEIEKLAEREGFSLEEVL